MTPLLGRRWAETLDIKHASGVGAADSAQGLVVVIDVLRAFTVSAVALASGARECLLVETVAEARDLATRLPAAVVSAEVDGLPVPGIPLSNSPSQLAALELRDKILVQRSSAGTQAMVRARQADVLLAASFVVASATARAVRRLDPPAVTLLATGEDHGHPEDRACALYVEGLLRAEPPDIDALLRPLRTSTRYQQLAAGAQPGFPPADLELALTVDRFDFAQQVVREDGMLKLRAVPPLFRAGG